LLAFVKKLGISLCKCGNIKLQLCRRGKVIIMENF
jgi:hypothetical protein